MSLLQSSETPFDKRKRQRLVVCQLVAEIITHARDKTDAQEIAELTQAGLEWAYGNGEEEAEKDQPPDTRALRVVC
jgi:hypothetical protein